MRIQSARYTSKPGLGQAVLDRTHPLAQGLVVAWLFNECGGSRVNDATGHGYYGNYSGSFASNTWLADASLVAGSAISFYALSNNRVACYRPQSGLPRSDGLLSMSVWVKFRSLSASTATIFCLDNGLSETDTNVTTPKTALVYIAGSTTLGATDDGGLLLAGQTITPVLNTWYHLVYTHNGTAIANGPHNFYINGNLVATGSTFAANTGTNTRVTVGSAFTLEDLDGSIAQALLYNRTLTQADVTELYRSPFCMLQPPAARRYWQYASTAVGVDTQEWRGCYPSARPMQVNVTY